MAKGKSPAKKETMFLVSFKLGQDFHDELKVYAETQVDESGSKLSPSLAARRLMLEALKRLHSKK